MERKCEVKPGPWGLESGVTNLSPHFCPDRDSRESDGHADCMSVESLTLNFLYFVCT